MNIEFIRNLLTEIRFLTWNIVDYLSDTHFSHYLRKLFSKNEISTTNKIESLSEIKREKEGNG